MAEMRTIYNEIMADLVSKGFGGIVSQIDPYYKNDCSIRQNQPPYETTYTDLKTKNERSPTALFLLDGGASLPIREVR
jgi:hypothetical protein